MDGRKKNAWDTPDIYRILQMLKTGQMPMEDASLLLGANSLAPFRVDLRKL